MTSILSFRNVVVPNMGRFHTVTDPHDTVLCLLHPVGDMTYPCWEKGFAMRVVGIDELEAYLHGLPPGPEGQALAWLDEAKVARWRGADEIREAFPRALV